ncbi:P-loop containing nucleoside triphosphate hydrolase protein [Cladochytrium replicatum]|nr:P-loop containing nucleoside triphosphate hydrolase protein [Cladochytrium replicatum]
MAFSNLVSRSDMLKPHNHKPLVKRQIMTGKDQRKRKAEDIEESVETASAQKKQQSGKKKVEDSSDSKKAATVTPKEHIPPESATFADLGLAEWLQGALRSLSIAKPTEIQRACIKPTLEGRDIIGSAKTGSGKTATFALPILQKLSENPYGTFALVLTPTRELAYQIAEQFRVLGQGISLKQCVVVGGRDMMEQALELSKRPHVVIATPGRLVDHIRSSSNALFIKKLRFLVLDEADRLLEDSFSDDLDTILNEVPANRQTLLFSATMTPEIEQIQELRAGETDARRPFVYHCATRFETVDQLDQRYVLLPSKVRDAYLTELLVNHFEGKTIIIFTGKCRNAERLRIVLRELGLRSTALHSQMPQNDRIGSLAKFKSGIVPILIATDVGGRGLDIPTVQVVINYELPADPTDYIHRVGRTARAGRGGLALSLVTQSDIEIFKNVEAKIQKTMPEYPIAESDALDYLDQVSLANRTASMHLLETKFGMKKRINMLKSSEASTASEKPKLKSKKVFSHSEIKNGAIHY